MLGTLDRLELQYVVTGSAASSVHGLWRATGDVDVVVRLLPEDIDPLAKELGAEFYIDEGEARASIETGRSFNVIHFESAFKFDIFPLKNDRYQQEQFARRRFESADVFGESPVELAVCSPEDVILSKLRWYRQGGEVSEQQWNDVLGVIAVQGERLDLDYMREWAAYLEVGDLLEQVLSERHEEGR